MMVRVAILIFILSTASLLKLAIITTTSSSSLSAPSPSIFQLNASSPSPTAKHDHDGDILPDKDLKFLSSIISQSSPCRLLVFGLSRHYYSTLTNLNTGGTTIFLDDNPARPSITAKRGSRVYKTEYYTVAKDAYKLLKHGRTSKACSPEYYAELPKSKCRLALTELPRQVYELKWDVVVVDGPCGHQPDCPGRMAAIYTAGVLARNCGGSTQVLVHDVDRIIERWFSWEFLGENNLVSSKGRFWNFRIQKQSNNHSTTFCSSST